MTWQLLARSRHSGLRLLVRLSISALIVVAATAAQSIPSASAADPLIPAGDYRISWSVAVDQNTTSSSASESQSSTYNVVGRARYSGQGVVHYAGYDSRFPEGDVLHTRTLSVDKTRMEWDLATYGRTESDYFCPGYRFTDSRSIQVDTRHSWVVDPNEHYATETTPIFLLQPYRGADGSLHMSYPIRTRPDDPWSWNQGGEPRTIVRQNERHLTIEYINCDLAPHDQTDSSRTEGTLDALFDTFDSIPRVLGRGRGFGTLDADSSGRRFTLDKSESIPLGPDTTGSIRVDAHMTVTPVNEPPVVDAGPSLHGRPGDPLSLAGSANDDGLPAPPGALSTRWSVRSAPEGGHVTFADPLAPVTTATFTGSGRYVLELAASDTDVTTTSTTTAEIQDEAPRLAGFSVEALSGSDNPRTPGFVTPVIWDAADPFEPAQSTPPVVGRTLGAFDASLGCPLGQGREWRSCDATGKPTTSPTLVWPVVAAADAQLVVGKVQVWVPPGTALVNQRLEGDAGEYGLLVAQRPFSIAAGDPDRLVDVGAVEFANPTALTRTPGRSELSIRWSLLGGSGAARPIGSTSLPVYVTAHAAFASLPKEGLVPQPYLTLVDAAVSAATGQSGDSAVFSSLYDRFRTLAMHRAELDPRTGNVTAETATLRYYQDGWSFESIVTSDAYWEGDGTPGRCSSDSTAGLLHAGVGFCGEWAHFLAEIAAVDGIVAKPFGLDEALALKKDRDTAMLVGTWTFGSRPHWNYYMIVGGTYTPFLFTDVHFVESVGQGPVRTSPGWFALGDHALVSYGGQVWDPSYGTGPFPSLAAWAAKSVAGYAVEYNAQKPSNYSVSSPSSAQCHKVCRWHFEVGPGKRFDKAIVP